MMVLLAELYLSYNFQWSWLYFKVTATSNSLKWKFHVLQRTWNLVWLFIFLDEILEHNTCGDFCIYWHVSLPTKSGTFACFPPDIVRVKSFGHGLPGVYWFIPVTLKGAVDVWFFPTVRTLRAVIWFHFTVSFLVHLPTSIALSVSAFRPVLQTFVSLQKILQYFLLRDRLFGTALVQQRRMIVGLWYVQHAAIWHWYYVCHYVFITFLIVSFHFFFTKFFNGGSINQMKVLDAYLVFWAQSATRDYIRAECQHVLALLFSCCCFFTRVISD